MVARSLKFSAPPPLSASLERGDPHERGPHEQGTPIAAEPHNGTVPRPFGALPNRSGLRPTCLDDHPTPAVSPITRASAFGWERNG
jgi:hypothetical protein